MREELGSSGCPIEDEYFGCDRKAGKKERKETQAKDRSQYKKTDQKKYYENLEKELAGKLTKQQRLEGRVLSILPQGVLVETEEGLLSCVLKGILKKDKTQAKNLVAVGDFVLVENRGGGEGIIAHIHPRKTILSRADNLSRRKEQLIAVNIDQVLITLSVVNPPLKSSIIDRYIIATQKGGMEPVIVINKVDLLKDEREENVILVEVENEIFNDVQAAYREAGIPFIGVSSVTGEGMDELKKIMTGKASVFSGQSGVGKSSLINTVTGSDLKTGEIVGKTKKGSHTTTTTQLLPLNFGGWCIDTPGIKSFGVWNLDRNQVQAYFPEIQVLSAYCKFTNCTHTHEQQCAVLEAVENETLSAIRYDSYQALMSSLEEDHVRR